MVGIGYREQELQQAKNPNFRSETASGVTYASFAGGTNIFIHGSGLHTTAQANRIVMYSHELKKDIPAPGLTEDDAFNSNVIGTGKLSYRVSSPHVLLGVPEEMLDEYQTMTFTIKIIAKNDLINEDENFECKT